MKKKSKNYVGYHIVARFLAFVGHAFFGEKIIGKENIPQTGKCILMCNHLSNFDAYILFSCTKRPIHILGKIELFTGSFGWFFKMMQVIPIDRQKQNIEARKTVIDLLNEEEVVAIFPEGTYHKETRLLPFKKGVVLFANATKAPIIPIAMAGKFKFRSHLKVSVGKPIYIDDIKEKDKVKYLENLMDGMLIELEK